MKKIGIMTWFHYNNFGTVLQSTALAEYLNKCGYIAEVINYIPSEPRKLDKLKIIKNPKLLVEKGKSTFINKVLYKNLQIKNDFNRNIKFDDYRKKYIRLSKRCEYASDLYKLNNYYDMFICGSDQIWAPSVYNPKYFLDFVDHNEKKIAYAPSIGFNEIKDKNIYQQMKMQWQNFGKLSIRESAGADIIEKALGIKPPVVVDPSFLLSKNDWCKLLDIKPKVNSKKYILCYFLGENKIYWKCVKKIAKKYGLEILVIPVHNRDYKFTGVTVLNGVDPHAFVEYISNATLVCTDSFHGTVFSIIFEKKFITYKRFKDNQYNSQNSRIYELLKSLDLTNRIYNINMNESILLENIDYNKVNILLKEKIKYSKNYLNDAAQSVGDNNNKLKKVTNSCSGCGICAVACPQNAIKIEMNNMGFYESKINLKKCIDCDICRKTCAFSSHKNKSLNLDDKPLYMYKSLDNQVLEKSSSGGFSFSLNQYQMKKGYSVCGCKYIKNEERAEHVILYNINELEDLQGSKYLQSNTVTAFKKILDEQKSIVTGTPCQMASLNNYLDFKGVRERYILVDLICHGVPTYKLWEKYIRELKKESKITKSPNVIFRNKIYGWRKYTMTVDFTNFKKSESENKNLFLRFFKVGDCYAESCYECPYRIKSGADIRIGDFWGTKYKNDTKGCSMIIPITEQGHSTLNEFTSNTSCQFIQEDIKDYWKNQLTINRCNTPYYNKLIGDLANNDIELKNLANIYCRNYEKYHNIYKFLKKILKIGE